MSVQRTPIAHGSFASTPLDHLLVYARNKRLTGVLETRSTDGRTASIVFWRGRISDARTTPPHCYFGALVYELGFIDAPMLDATLLEVAQKKKLHGEVLLARGAITRAQRDEALSEQAARKVHHVFSFDAASTYAFYEGTSGLAEPPVTLDPLVPVWRGIRDVAPAAIRAVVTKYAGVPLRMVNEAPLASVDLAPEERDLCEALAFRPLTIAELHAHGRVTSGRLEQLVYLLLIGKCIEPVPVAATTGPPPAARSEPRIRTTTDELVAPSVARRPPSFRIPSAASLPAMAGRPLSTPAMPAVQITGPVTTPAELGVEGIAARVEAAKTESYFALLGLPEGASPEAIRAAYFRFAKVWHPDRLPPELAAARENVARMLGILTNAHRTLSDAESRRNYLASRVGGPARTRPRAEAIRDVDAALARHDFAGAAMEARTMCQSDPEDAEALALLAWAEVRAGDASEEEVRSAILSLDRAVNSDRYCERAHYYRGLLWKQLGNAGHAVRDFARVLVLDPGHVDAAREVRIHEMRAKKR